MRHAQLSNWRVTASGGGGGLGNGPGIGDHRDISEEDIILWDRVRDKSVPQKPCPGSFRLPGVQPGCNHRQEAGPVKATSLAQIGDKEQDESEGEGGGLLTMDSQGHISIDQPEISSECLPPGLVKDVP